MVLLIVASMFPFSEYTLKLTADLESASRLRAAQYFVTQRPWLGYFSFSLIYYLEFFSCNFDA